MTYFWAIPSWFQSEKQYLSLFLHKWSAFSEIWYCPLKVVHHIWMHNCGTMNRSGKRNWSMPRVQFYMRLQCLQSKLKSGLWTHMQHCAYVHRPAVIDQQWYACGQILTAWHTCVSYVVVNFSCPHLFGANHSTLWEHVNNQSLLIPFYHLCANFEDASCPSRWGSTAFYIVSLGHTMIEIVNIHLLLKKDSSYIYCA